MRQIIFIGLCYILLSTVTSYGQTKFEREYRLKATEVPLIARKYVANLGFTQKIKWYKEISQDGKSIEAKTKWANKCYSIEFAEDGQLEDIEIKITWKELPEILQDKISKKLSAKFDTYKINKIQRQYTGEATILKKVVLGDKAERNFTTRYELIIKGKKDKKVKLYEFLFSDKGEILETFTIELRNTDNLEY